MSDYQLIANRVDGPPIEMEFDRLADAVDAFNNSRWNPKNTRIVVRGHGYPIKWFAQQPCIGCGGLGTEMHHFGACTSCGGTGVIETGYGPDTIEVPCPCSESVEPEAS